jgi:hypothetical protein
MPNTIFMESGTGATQDLSFWSTIIGTVSSDSASPITGSRSLKLFTGSPAVAASITRNASMADTGRRMTFRYKFDLFPSTGNASFYSCRTAANAVIYQVNLTAAGILTLLTTGAGSVTGITPLVANTPYRIAVAHVITSSTVWSINVYLNGHLELSYSNAGTLTNTVSDRFNFTTTANIINQSYWFDDIFLDDGTDLGDPGNIIVTHRRPVANGALNQWTTQIGSGGSGYGAGHSSQVNELPISTINGWSISSASLLTEEYTIESPSTGDIDVSGAAYSLVDYTGWTNAKCASGTPTANIIVNGTVFPRTMTVSYGVRFNAAGSTTYPSGNNAIGMDNNATAQLFSLADCGILLAYTYNPPLAASVGLFALTGQDVTLSVGDAAVIVKGAGIGRWFLEQIRKRKEKLKPPPNIYVTAGPAAQTLISAHASRRFIASVPAVTVSAGRARAHSSKVNVTLPRQSVSASIVLADTLGDVTTQIDLTDEEIIALMNESNGL